METVKWAGYEWLPQERWGNIHPDNTLQWHDPSAIQKKEDGSISLFTHKNTKFFPQLDTHCDIGVGWLSCTEKFGHGFFEIECKLPTGKHLWPAFWMWGWDSWPPEIDVFEAYSKKHEGYFRLRLKNLLGFWDVKTNVHHTSYEGTSTSVGSSPHFFGFKNPRKHYMKYAVNWLPDRLEFFYNGRKVRTINDQHVLSQLNNAGGMNVIINAGVQKEIDAEDCHSEFNIKNFTFSPYL